MALSSWQVLPAAVFDVGPGQPLQAIGEVPWESLLPGDTVRIHWRAAPYHEKWVLARQGTDQDPITVTGVPGPAGELPVIDGDGATTRTALNYWSETRGILKIGGSSVPPNVMPRHIVVEGLDFRNARSPLGFTDDSGSPQVYQGNASGIFLEKGEDIAIRNCVFRDSGNGLFVASSDTEPSRNILIEGNYFHDNGNPGSAFEHNTYTAALGITFQFNRFGPPCAGCDGNNLKDRSAGTVIRYNWIEGGNRQLDLVDAEDSSQIAGDPTYAETFVYGNVLIEPDGAGNRQILHYGGDSGNTAAYRKGTLYFYNNTVVSLRNGRTTLMRLSTNDERCDSRNNIVYTALTGGDELSLLDASGVLDWTHNWVKPGWVATFGTLTGTLNDAGTSIEGPAPGFVDGSAQDYRLVAGAPARDAGTPQHPLTSPAHDVLLQYEPHRSTTLRPTDGLLDLGAFEYCAATAPGTIANLTLASGGPTLAWPPAPGATTYDVITGDLQALGAAGGDFGASAATCAATALKAATWADTEPLAPGAARYYLVRAVNCAGAGSLDSAGPAQAAGRDPRLPACDP